MRAKRVEVGRIARLIGAASPPCRGLRPAGNRCLSLAVVWGFITAGPLGFCLGAPGLAPEPSPAVTSPAAAGSIIPAPDTTRAPEGLDTVITYTARAVTVTFQPRITVLEGGAKVRYRSMTLDAEHIEVHWDDDLLVARGKLDTIRTGSTGAVRDSIYWKGLPRLLDGAQVITGREMVYNLKSKRGRVTEGTTDYLDGYYHGHTIKKVDEDVYNIHSGFYTTCDLKQPHYGFWSRDMKPVSYTHLTLPTN